jgi:hypothetical protein
MGWKYAGSTHEDSFIIGELDIFKEKWERTGERIQVKDPIYHQLFTFDVYKVKSGDEEIVFAAGEFSNNIFGIYVQKKQN